MKPPTIHGLLIIRIKGRPRKQVLNDQRGLLEERMQKHLDKRCVVVVKGNEIRVEIQGKFTMSELHHKACGAMRVYEWEAA
jgi:hypothetical protein